MPRKGKPIHPSEKHARKGEHLPVPREPLSGPSLPSPPGDKRAKALVRIAGRMQMWRPAREVLKRVRAVPTIFPWLDYATKVGGLPVGRLTLVHGPSMEGKSILCLGLGLSFLKRGHFFGYVDAEFSSPITWLEGLMAEYADDPLFMGKRPKSFEDVVDSVRQMLKVIISAKESGEMPDAAAVIVVDSIRKLIPEDFLAKIQKYGAQGEKGSVDGMSGMGGAIKAKMVADWLDELTPLLYRADAALVAIGRESVNRDAGKGGPSWKLSGGGSLLFESSLAMRIERDWVREGTGPDAIIIGEKHEGGIYKSKVAGKEEKVEYFSFHTSNGVATPEGFEPARDLLELGIQLGVVKGSGSWFTFSPPGGKALRWQGKNQAVKRLSVDAGLRESLDRMVRGKFRAVETEGLGPIVASKPARKEDHA